MNNVKKTKPTMSTGCGPKIFPKTAPIKLPAEFEYMNRDYEHLDSVKLEFETRGQSKFENWQKERACRVTASNFGRILGRKSTPTDKFLDSLFQTKSISTLRIR